MPNNHWSLEVGARALEPRDCQANAGSWEQKTNKGLYSCKTNQQEESNGPPPAKKRVDGEAEEEEEPRGQGEAWSVSFISNYFLKRQQTELIHSLIQCNSVLNKKEIKRSSKEGGHAPHGSRCNKYHVSLKSKYALLKFPDFPGGNLTSTPKL